MSEDQTVETGDETVEAQLRASLAELKEAQARLQIADRMASMGMLAAGVAHEINNPLAFVVANLDFAREDLRALRAGPPNQEQLEKRLDAISFALSEAQEGASRVRNIVLDLKTFSHPDAEFRGPVDLCRVVDSAVNLARGEIRDSAEIVRRFHPVPPVVGNEARLSQLFLNLVVNAAQAILGRDVAPAKHEIRLTIERAADGRVMAEIADTGVGIPPEHLARIFDPFFTTKPIGMGTGLGLSICHGIARSLGGDITVASTVGAGSAFRVWLPVAADGTATGAGGGARTRTGKPEADPSARS
jgi:signal transduction histidine kinase